MTFRRKPVLFAALILLCLMAALPACAENATVKGGYLRLRTLPSTAAPILDRYPSGTVVSILGTEGDWMFVQANDGNRGYMMAAYLDTGASPASTSVASAVSGTAYITSSNGKSVNLRTRASTKSVSIRLYPVGTKVTVIGTSGVWKKVRVDGNTGYIQTRYLSSAKVTAPSSHNSATASSASAKIRSSDGKSVNMRSGPSKKNPVIGRFEVGTSVTVLKKGTVWSYVSISGQVGYIMTAYLRF